MNEDSALSGFILLLGIALLFIVCIIVVNAVVKWLKK